MSITAKFADQFRSGAQGATMEADAAMDLAMAIDSLRTSSSNLMMAADRAAKKYGADKDWTEWQDLRDSIRTMKIMLEAE